MFRAGFLLGFLTVALPLLATGPATRAVRGRPQPQGVIAPPSSSGQLTEDEKLDIIRNVDGEYVKVVRPLPSLKSGFILKPGRKFDSQALKMALIRSLPAASPGDRVQITGIRFRPTQILVNINGGSRPNKKNWRQRIHIQMGMPFPTTQVVRNQPPGLIERGSTLILDFGHPVPAIGPAQVKHYLAPFLDFNSAHSAAQNWVDTIPVRFRKAIQKHEAIVGMNRQMVLAALGRADHKVRDFKPDGTETEDWIYGSPPGTTIFVTFEGNTVIRVKQFP